ncbi:hypothetical protein P9112_003219 [Eukaryota sp. TZLM1-RC]
MENRALKPTVITVDSRESISVARYPQVAAYLKQTGRETISQYVEALTVYVSHMSSNHVSSDMTRRYPSATHSQSPSCSKATEPSSYDSDREAIKALAQEVAALKSKLSLAEKSELSTEKSSESTPISIETGKPCPSFNPRDFKLPSELAYEDSLDHSSDSSDSTNVATFENHAHICIMYYCPRGAINPNDPETVLSHLLSFCRFKDSAEAYHKLQSLKLNLSVSTSEEAITSYISAFLKKLRLCPSKLPEAARMKSFVNGIRPERLRFIIRTDVEIGSITSFSSLVHRSSNKSNPARSTSKSSPSYQSPHSERKYFSPQKSLSPITCFYCKKPGHMVKDCPKPGCKISKTSRMYGNNPTLQRRHNLRDWLPSVSKELAPLTALLKNKPKRIKLGPQEFQCFDNIKEMVINNLPLALPDSDGTILVSTDASNKAIAGIIWKEFEPSSPGTCLSKRKVMPVSFYSRILTSSQQRWSTLQKELFAIVMTLNQPNLSSFLLTKHLTILCDHENFAYLCSCPDDNRVVLRWISVFQFFSFYCVHIEGTKNYWADYLSRANYVESAPKKKKKRRRAEVSLTNLPRFVLHDDPSRIG